MGEFSSGEYALFVPDPQVNPCKSMTMTRKVWNTDKGTSSLIWSACFDDLVDEQMLCPMSGFPLVGSCTECIEGL